MATPRQPLWQCGSVLSTRRFVSSSALSSGQCSICSRVRVPPVVQRCNAAASAAMGAANCMPVRAADLLFAKTMLGTVVLSNAFETCSAPSEREIAASDPSVAAMSVS